MKYFQILPPGTNAPFALVKHASADILKG